MYDHGPPSSPSTSISFPLCAQFSSAGDRKMILAHECDYCDDSESYNQIQFGNANNLRLTLSSRLRPLSRANAIIRPSMPNQTKPHLFKTNICIRLYDLALRSPILRAEI